MSGTAKVKPPKDDAEWARNTQRRIEQVENPASTRIGAWVLSTDPESGNLIASNVNGGAVVLANQPEGEGEADTVASAWSHLKLSRRNPQTMSGRNHTPIGWDTVDSSTDDWSVSAGSSSVVFPGSGVWIVTYNLRYGLTTGWDAEGRVYLNGSPVLADRTVQTSSSTNPTVLCSSTFSVSAGSELYCTSWLNIDGSYAAGPSSSISSDVTSLSLTRIPIG